MAVLEPPPECLEVALLSLPDELLDKILINVASGATARETSDLLSVCTRFCATLRAASAVRPTQACALLDQVPGEHTASFLPLRLRDCLALDAIKLPHRSCFEKPLLVKGDFAARPGATDMLPLLALTRMEALTLFTVRSKLRALDNLRCLRITDTLLESLLQSHKLTQLQSLYVHGVNIPRSVMDALGDMRHLRELSLIGQVYGDTRFAAVSLDTAQPLGQLTNLELLCLDVAMRDFLWLDHFALVTRLTRLHISLRGVLDPSEVHDPLERSNAFTSELLLMDMVALSDVQLTSGRWDELSLAVLASLPALTRLDLSRGSGLEPTVLEPLAAAPALRHLSLRGCSLSDDCAAPLARLSGLLSLDLADNAALTDASLWHLAELTALTALGLENNSKLTQLPLAELLALECLDVHGTSIPLAVVVSLDRASSLRMLGVGAAAGTQGVDIGAAQLSCCSSLRHVQLLTNDDFEAAAGDLEIPPHVRSMRMTRTVVGVRVLSHFAFCLRLECVTLQKLPPGAEVAALAHLAAAPALQQLFVIEGVPPRLAAEAFSGSKTLRSLGLVKPEWHLTEFQELSCLSAIQPLRQVLLQSGAVSSCGRCAAVVSWLSASDVQLVAHWDLADATRPLLAAS